jgi:hypothetical protein
MQQGLITTVNYENGAVVCNVQAIRGSNEYRDVPVIPLHPGFSVLPRQGETVLLGDVEGRKAIIGSLSLEQEAPTAPAEGDLAIQLDANTKIIFERGGGTIDVQISSSGDLALSSEGNVSIDAGGSVSINGSSVSINGIDFGSHTHTENDSGGQTGGPQ